MEKINLRKETKGKGNLLKLENFKIIEDFKRNQGTLGVNVSFEYKDKKYYADKSYIADYLNYIDGYNEIMIFKIEDNGKINRTDLYSHREEGARDFKSLIDGILEFIKSL